MKMMYPHPYPFRILILNILDILEKKDSALSALHPTCKEITISFNYSWS